ncbi:hypothetical protein V513_13820 [Mesotoga sp. H07.pep.5.3]|nr:hypothetical protein V513_13820 [Mesotoga sp. H07.pep.5.3]
MNNLVRAKGNAQKFMVAMVSGALLIVALFPVFIFGCGMSIVGAAVATVISVCFDDDHSRVLHKKEELHESIYNTVQALSLQIYSEIFKIRLSTLLRQSLSSFAPHF